MIRFAPAAGSVTLCVVFAVLAACGDDSTSSGSSGDGDGEGEGGGDGQGGGATTGEGSGGSTSPSSGGSGPGSTGVSSSTGGADGWTCGLVNDACYCDDVFMYRMPECGGGWSCCIYWPGDNGNSCQCSNDSDAECMEFVEANPATSIVGQCPP